MQILCSTGAFTRSSDPDSHEVSLRYGREFVADGLELIFYPRWYQNPEHIVHALRSCKLPFPVLHMEKSIGDCFGSSQANEREQGVLRFEQNCAFAQGIGAEIAVLHLWGLPSSDLQLEHNLQPLTRCLDRASQYGLTLAIETIPCTYADPLSNVRRAVEHDPRACVALDTQFLAWHDQLEAVFAASWLWQAKKVRHVHLKDHEGPFGSQGGRHYLHPGEGQINFRRIVQQLRAGGFTGALSLEARAIDSENQVEVARIQTSLQFMRDLTAEGELESAESGTDAHPFREVAVRAND
jgi:sugar phosphate isomerase/epimerase